MTRADLSFVAAVLLDFVAAANPALAGDLMEERLAGRSRRWFWRQLLGAVVIAAWHRRRAEPLAPRFVEAGPEDFPVRSTGLLDPSLINLSGINVRGVGGLGLLAVIVLMTLVMPETWWLVAIGLAGGIIVGIVLVRRRREAGLSGPSGGGPISLFGAAPARTGDQAAAARSSPRVEQFAAV